MWRGVEWAQRDAWNIVHSSLTRIEGPLLSNGGVSIEIDQTFEQSTFACDFEIQNRIRSLPSRSRCVVEIVSHCPKERKITSDSAHIFT